MTRYPRILALLSVLVGLVAAGAAGAQYRYVPPGGGVGPGYNPGYPGYGYYPTIPDPWQGSAAIMDAYGNLGKSQEEARIMREQANQAKLDTRVKLVDVTNYERANKYWYSDEKADIESKKVAAAMNSPPIQEITSGRSLNVLLPFLDKQLSQGARGPTIPIDPEINKAINVTSGDDGGNAGLLRQIQALDWPPSTQGPNQKKLDEMLQAATYDTSKGPVNATTISKLNKQTDVVEEEVRKKFHKSEIDGGEYLEGKRFLERVREATKALKQPNAAKVLSGQVGCHGDTVDQVVYNMSSKGLSFGKAQPGQESAYIAMHRAFVNFGLATGTTDTGFRVRIPGVAGGKDATRPEASK